MMKVCVAQIGARRHYAVPVALHHAGMLDSLHTDWCVNRGLPSLVAAVTPKSLQTGAIRRVTDRRVPEIPSRRIRTYFRYALRMALVRKRSSVSNYEYWARANRAFGLCVTERGFGQSNMVYGFNAAAVEILQAARHQGLRTVLDQTMAPWVSVETLLAAERQRWPGWDNNRSEEGWRELADREAQEWDAADVIICGSPFVVQAIADRGGPVDRCRVVPYGYDGLVDERTNAPTNGGPLRVLFVGTVDLRKGIPYLMLAAKALHRNVAEFRIVGPIGISDSAVATLRQVADVRGPIPRSNVSEHYDWADVFVLPTLAEGSANVCYEAMAHGLPIITTPNAGSVVRDGVDGWIVPPHSEEPLMELIERLADDRERLAIASISARERAATFTWERYGSELVKALSEATIADQPQTHLAVH